MGIGIPKAFLGEFKSSLFTTNCVLAPPSRLAAVVAPYFSKTSIPSLKVIPAYDAYQIYDEARKQISNISLGTVYRNLGGLENDNLIISLMVNGVKHYDKVIPHYHFICKKCSKIVDVFDVKFPKIEKIENNIVSDYKIFFKGICGECQKEEVKNRIKGK